MRGLLAVSLGLLMIAGCPAKVPESDGRMPPPLDQRYPHGPDGLKALWTDILTAAQKDERERVHVLMASLMMSDADLDGLFGVEPAKWLRPRYLPMMATLVNIGSMELVARVDERKYDDIEVIPVDEKGGEADRATLRALPPGTNVYNVRVKRKVDVKGLLYTFFVYRNGHWVTGNELATKYLVEARIAIGGSSTRHDGGIARDGGR